MAVMVNCFYDHRIRGVAFYDIVIYSKIKSISVPIAYVLINCDLGFEEPIIKEISKMPEVKEVRGVYGVFDIFVRVESDDLERVREVVTRQIRRLDRVRSTNTLMAIEGQGGK